MFSVLERIKLEYHTSSTHIHTFVIVFALSFASMKKKTKRAYNRTNEERKNGNERIRERENEEERKRTKGTEREIEKKNEKVCTECWHILHKIKNYQQQKR